MTSNMRDMEPPSESVPISEMALKSQFSRKTEMIWRHAMTYKVFHKYLAVEHWIRYLTQSAGTSKLISYCFIQHKVKWNYYNLDQ